MLRKLFALLLLVGCCSVAEAQSKKAPSDSMWYDFKARYYDVSPCGCGSGLRDSAFSSNPYHFSKRNKPIRLDSADAELFKMLIKEDSARFKKSIKPKIGV